MGEVLQVEDPDLGRKLAAKIIRDQSNDALVQRFVQEAQITGQLEHPNIIPVHELGVSSDGRIYFTMLQVQGQTLEDLVGRGRSSLVELLQTFLKICDALRYAHSKGVIHRDLKPANVMVGEFGEVLVMDWGLAKLVDQPDLSGDAVTPGSGGSSQAPLRTLDGAVLGTPAYMPPEQAEGRTDLLDERADVYALGAILYQVLTGVPPFEGRDPWAVLAKVKEDTPVPPGKRAPDREIPWELETVVATAMSRKRARRYRTVDELRQDVARYLEGRPLAAASYGPVQLMVKWAGRNKALVSAVTAVVLTGLVAGVLAFVRIDDERRAAVKSESAALKSEADAITARDNESKSRRAAEAARAREKAARDKAETARERLEIQARLVQFSRKISEARGYFYIAKLDIKTKMAELRGVLAELEQLAAQPDFSRHPEVYTLLGLGRYFVGEYEAAERALLTAHELAPDDPWVTFCLGRMYAGHCVRALGYGEDLDERIHNSERWARKALEYLGSELTDLEPLDKHQAQVLRALVEGRAADARKLCQEGLEKYGGRMGAEDYWVGLAYGQISRTQIRELLKRIQSGKLDGQFLLLMASVMTSQVNAWTKALEIRPHYPDAYFSRGLAYHYLRKHDAAIADFDAVIDINPRLVWAWYRRGKVYWLKGDKRRAMADLRRAHELATDVERPTIADLIEQVRAND